MPYIQKLHDEYKPQEGREEGGIIVLGVALDSSGSKIVKPFFNKLNFKACYRYGEGAEEVERMDYLEFIGRVTSHIPDSQVTVRYFGLYANANRGKVRKTRPDTHPFIIVEKESPRIPRRGWAEMIKKVYEVDPLLCPQCQSRMHIIAFLTDYAVVDRIIAHLKLTFVAERPPPPHVVSQEFLMNSETGAEYFS